MSKKTDNSHCLGSPRAEIEAMIEVTKSRVRADHPGEEVPDFTVEMLVEVGNLKICGNHPRMYVQTPSARRQVKLLREAGHPLFSGDSWRNDDDPEKIPYDEPAP